MASITIRNLDDEVKQRLRVRAAENRRSMEAEAREIIERSVRQRNDDDTVPKGESAADFFRRIFHWDKETDADDDFDLMDYIPPREPMREPPTFD